MSEESRIFSSLNFTANISCFQNEPIFTPPSPA